MGATFKIDLYVFGGLQALSQSFSAILVKLKHSDLANKSNSLQWHRNGGHFQCWKKIWKWFCIQIVWQIPWKERSEAGYSEWPQMTCWPRCSRNHKPVLKIYILHFCYYFSIMFICKVVRGAFQQFEKFFRGIWLEVKFEEWMIWKTMSSQRNLTIHSMILN